MNISHNVRMEPKDRLKQARTDAGYASPTDAARVLKDINQNTLISHENGNRPISRKAAEKYGQAFGVEPGWILFGEDGEASSLIEGPAQIEATLRRIKGLNDLDITIALGVIMNAIKVNEASQADTADDDQSQSSTPHRELKPIGQR